MHKRGFILGLILFFTLTLASLLTHSAAQSGKLPNPLVIVSNQGQAGPNVDKTLVQSVTDDPATGWRGRFFDASGWYTASPVMRAITWTSSSAITPLLSAGADHIWGGPLGSLMDDAGNSTEYPRREYPPGSNDYAHGYPIPASPSPQYLFLRKDFCLPINAQADALRHLTAGDISITLLNATDSTTVLDGAASVWLNETTIAFVPGDESGSTTLIDIPAPIFLFRGRNTLAMRVGDAGSDSMAAILYHAAFSYAIDPNALTIGVNTTMPFETELVQFDAVPDELSDRPPFSYDWTFGDGNGGVGDSVGHVYTATGTYTVSLTVADTELCTGTAELPITVLPFPLNITKTATPDPVTAGGDLIYYITVQNTSPVRALTGVLVTDELPPGTTYNGCGSCTPPIPPNPTVRWELGTLGPGESSTLDLYVTIALTASGTLTNSAYGVLTNEVYTTGTPIAVEVLPPPCLYTLTSVDVTGPITGSIGNLYPFTGTIAPPYATEPIYYTWIPTPTAGQSTPDASYQWVTPGLHTIALRAENCGGAITATHVISVSSPCPRPLTDVGIIGPTSGITDTWYDFISVITPTDATQPITLTWSPIPINGQGVHTATYQWTTPGLHILTLTIENCGRIVSTTHAISISASSPITCPRPLIGLNISGPTNGYTDAFYDFIAVPNPVDATEPITLTWSPTPISGQGAHTVTYQWDTIGSYTITLTAENCGGPFATAHTIDIQVRQPAVVYLPLVLRNYPDDAPNACPGWSLSIGEPFDEDFDHADDYDWFTFQATAGVSYTIRTQELEIRADTVISLYNSTCTNLLAWNDDLPLPYPTLSRASQIEWQASSSGPLHVLVRNFEPNYFGPDTGYSLAVYDENNPPPPIDDAPDVCAAATPLPIGQPYTNDFDHANDNDWFAFDVTVGRTYTITTGNLGTQADTILELWDNECLTQLFVDDDPAAPEAQIVWLAIADGELRVGVRSYDWTVYGPNTDYTVTIEEE